jgi:hypothetical protein
MPDFDSIRSTRRHFLASQSFSVGSVALAWLIGNEPAQAKPARPDLAPPRYTLEPRSPAHEPRAKAMISLWMQGGPSQVDLFDPKPELQRRSGQPFPGEIKYDNAAEASATILASPWKFSRHGECGMELSELLPHTARIADEVCLIRSMQTSVNNHGQAIRALNTGKVLDNQPSLGSWLTFALGSESQDLPPYIALVDPGQLPVLGVENWAHGWLPSLYQGTVVRPREPRVFNLTPPARWQGEAQARYLDYLGRLNRKHLADHPRELDLEARIASFELAARMQTAAAEALDLSRETAHTRRMYGLEDPATADYGARCLIARRLVERGVRFVQVFTENQRWDHHHAIRTGLTSACRKVDQPSAALVVDLKQRGLLGSTIVHWGGEMGRLPVIQNDTGPDKIGRDHNTYGFSMWVAGGGFKSGLVFGATDAFGHRAVENVVTHHDYHATLLHLFGLDSSRTSFKQNNQDRALLDEGQGRVVREILA